MGNLAPGVPFHAANPSRPSEACAVHSGIQFTLPAGQARVCFVSAQRGALQSRRFGHTEISLPEVCSSP